ncbi:hypothetical protein PIB30_089709 [Stylosanthes scabra]|uniref:CCHC-type domain-containing protein n=1 Tax=Stylosanthes scabra TaxID=79078 RepID=A0ABU6YTK7_9FABA|nr:hypothetical protein [Stylosanthes scabra]
MLSMRLSSTELNECLSAKACGLKTEFGIDDPNDSQNSIKFRLGVLSAECSRMMDIAFVKSKGVPKRNTKFKYRRRCSNCGAIGHYNRSCPNNDDGNQDDSLAADAKARRSNTHRLHLR